MSKRSIAVPDAVGLSRPRTRREFLGALAAAGAGATVGSTFLTGKASAQSGSSDIDILNFALTIEYFESEEFYPTALKAGILSGDARAVVSQLVDIEVQHRDALIALIKNLGGEPVEKPQFVLPDSIFASEAAFLQAALTQEQTDVGAFLGAAPMIQNPDVLAAAGAIAGVEGENVVAVKNLLGVVPPANEAFPAALTQDQVLAVLAPFLGMGAMMDTGGPAPVYGTGKKF
jgi:rubrerythrin